MTPAELVRALCAARVRVIEADGRPALDGPPGAITDDLVTAARAHRWLFVWGIEGARTGHAWNACTACGEVQLLHHRPKPVRCGLSIGCEGVMRPLPDIWGRLGASTHDGPTVSRTHHDGMVATDVR